VTAGLEPSRRQVVLVKPSWADRPIAMVAYPEHGCWYELGHVDEVGAFWAPMRLSGAPPDPEEVGEIEVRREDA
jgi:hypothetical protein